LHENDRQSLSGALLSLETTAQTEEEEFIKIYGMEVAVIPTNQQMIRDDMPDVIYKTKEGKLNAIVADIRQIHATKQPILVGTISIEASEELSRRLKKKRVEHVVLNAKYHEQEAEIIAHAGEQGRVTIATNMAGRGTDIKLGEGVTKLHGLFIIGTERHESRRIDNQLRGRSGRQGDPGCSRFYLSLEDDLMRIFGGQRIAGLMNRLKVEDDEAITHVLISRAIENAQKKVEAHHFEIRKHVLEYDDVMNRQREVIYGQRREILGGEVENVMLDMADEVLEDIISLHTESKHNDEWDTEGLNVQFLNTFAQQAQADWNDKALSPDVLRKDLMAQVEALYRAKGEEVKQVMTQMRAEPLPPEEVEAVFRDFERQILLGGNDSLWKDHLLSMDHLREGIGLVGYAQKKPIDEYKRGRFRHVLRSHVSHQQACRVHVLPRSHRRTGAAARGTQTAQSFLSPWGRRRRRKAGAQTTDTKSGPSGPQRSLSLRQRQKVQGLPHAPGTAAGGQLRRHRITARGALRGSPAAAQRTLK